VIVAAAGRLLDDASAAAAIAASENPFGDGFAAMRIVQVLRQWAPRVSARMTAMAPTTYVPDQLRNAQAR
jgi:hypothetical protein